MASEPLRLVIEGGKLRAVYDDRLLPYLEAVRRQLGLPAYALQLTRASHVEPAPPGGEALWWVDLGPVGGGLYSADEYGQPFRTKTAALAFEHRWLEENWLCCIAKRGPSSGTT